MIRRVGKSDYNEVRKLVSQVHQIHLNNRCDIYIDGEVLEYDYFNEIINIYYNCYFFDTNQINYTIETNLGFKNYTFTVLNNTICEIEENNI